MKKAKEPNVSALIFGIYDERLESYVQISTYGNKSAGIRACVATIAYSNNDSLSKFTSDYRIDILGKISVCDGIIESHIERCGYVSELQKIIEGNNV